MEQVASFLLRVLASFQPMVDALRDARYASFALGNFISFVGAWMQRVMLGWLVWELTHSGFWLGLLVACDFGPAVLLGPIGGVLGDRFDQGRVIVYTQALTALNGLALALTAALGAGSAPILIAFAMASGVFNALSDAARLSIVRRISTDETFAASMAMTSVSFNLARFIGPVLGGVALASWGAGAGFAIAALLCGPFIWALLRIGPLRPAAEESAERKHVLREIADGIAYVASHGDIRRGFAVFLCCAALVRPAYELMPGVVGGLFEGDVELFSAMIASIGLGAVVAAINLTRTTDPRVMDAVILRGSLGSAGALALLVLTPSHTMALIAAALLGYFVSTNANGALIFAQIQADRAFQARVASLWSIIVRAAPGIGALVIGGVADWAGFRWPLATALLLCVAASLAFASWRPKPGA